MKIYQNKEFLIEALKSPNSIAALVLDSIQADLGGDTVIADVNNPACHLLEAVATIASGLSDVIENKALSLYAQRAQNMSQLYPHMGDYDYVGSYATPAQATMMMLLPKHDLFTKSIPVNEVYNKVTIPRDTVITYGQYVFGIHYPIDILINKVSKTYVVEYDTTENNSLYQLTSNVISSYTTTISGVEFLVFTFPVYQFRRGTAIEPLISETGYSVRKKYMDKFYAIKLYHYKDGEYHEIHQTQSDSVYDLSKVTAIVRVYPDSNTVVINIPQIYFDSNMTGSQIYIELYTTLGEMDVNTGAFQSSEIQVNYDINSKYATEYSTFFRKLTYDSAIRFHSDKIVGGSNGMSFEQLREAVINDGLETRAPISVLELTNRLSQDGFSITKSKDNVTDRIYYAYRVLRDHTGSIIPSINLSAVYSETICNNCATIVKQPDDSYTVLPSTMYKFNKDTNLAEPLSRTETEAIANFDKAAMVNYLNNNKVYRSPFFIRLDVLGSIATAVSYNLMSPCIERTVFEGANNTVPSRLISYSSEIVHPDKLDGYYMGISVYRSEDLRKVDPSNVAVYACVRNVDGHWVGTEAEFDHISTVNEGNAVYRLKIATKYHITVNGDIGITNFTSTSGNTSENIIAMEPQLHLIFLVKRALYKRVDYVESSANLIRGLPDKYKDYIAIGRQHLDITLGTSLADVIYNPIEVVGTAKGYETWARDVPLTYENDVYAKDEKGVLVVKVVNGKVVLTKEHSAGDIVLDDAGEIVYKHRKGDVVYDSTGKPKIAVDRTKEFNVDLIMLDAKLYASEKTSELKFVDSIYQTFESYFKLIRNIQKQLLERTKIYFRCVRSTGAAEFNYGDGVTGMSDIEMSFSINCYVPSYIKKDEAIQENIRKQIGATIESALSSRTVSMLDIFEVVKSKLNDYIDHFSLLGINGDVTCQTFTLMSEDAQPSVARSLFLTDDNVITLVQNIDINFIALVENISQDTVELSS